GLAFGQARHLRAPRRLGTLSPALPALSPLRVHPVEPVLDGRGGPAVTGAGAGGAIRGAGPRLQRPNAPVDGVPAHATSRRTSPMRSSTGRPSASASRCRTSTVPPLLPVSRWLMVDWPSLARLASSAWENPARTRHCRSACGFT